MSERRLISADEMDRMTPSERAAAFDAAIVRDLADLPEAFRAEVEATARALEEKLSGRTPG